MLNFIMTDPSTKSVEDANTSTDQSTPTLRAISTTDKKKSYVTQRVFNILIRESYGPLIFSDHWAAYKIRSRIRTASWIIDK